MDFTNTQGTWKQIKEYIDSKLSGGDDNLPVGTLLTTYNNKDVFGDKWKLADGSILKEYNELYDTTKVYPNSDLTTSAAEELFNSGNFSSKIAYDGNSSYNGYISVLAQKKIGEYIYFVTKNQYDKNDVYRISVRVIRFNINNHTIEYLYNGQSYSSYEYKYGATINSYGIVIQLWSETFVKYTYCLGFNKFEFKSVTLETSSDDPFDEIFAFCISDEKVFFYQTEGTYRRGGFIQSNSYTFKDLIKDTTGATYQPRILDWYEYNGDVFIGSYEGYMKLNPDTFVVEYSNAKLVTSFIQNLDDPDSMYYLVSDTLYKTQEFPTGASTIVATNTSLKLYSLASFLNFQGYNLVFGDLNSGVLSDQYTIISYTLMPNTNVIYAYLEDANTIIYICLYYNTGSFVITKYRIAYDQSWCTLPTISNTFIKIKS